MTTKEQVKKEFDDFAGKIGRLESLKRELDALDTGGYEKEARAIRASLKDINAIPRLSKQISDLRGKINLGKKEVKVVKKKRIFFRKKENSADLKELREISKLHKKIDNLNRKFGREIGSRTRKVKIDSGVGVLVDSRFDDFVLGIKSELSRRLKDRKEIIGGILRGDLERQHKMFEEKYRNLVNEYHEKYRKRVSHSLRGEIKRKFKEEMDKRFMEERNKMVEALLRENDRKVREEKRKVDRALHGHYSSMERGLKIKISSEKNLIDRKLAGVENREDDLIARKKKHEQDVQKMKEGFARMKRKESQNFERMKEEENKKFERMESEEKRELELVLRKKEKEIEDGRKEMEKRREEVEEERRRVMARMRENKRKSGEKERSRMEALKMKLSVLLRSERRERKRIENMGKKRLEKRREELIERERDIVARRAEVMQRLNKLRDERMRRIDNKENELNLLLESARKKEKDIDFVLTEKKKSLEQERKRLEYGTKMIKIQGEKRIAEIERKEKERLVGEVNNIKGKLQQKYFDRVSRMGLEYNKKLNKEVAVKEKEMKTNFNTQLEARVSKEVAKKEKELRRKKEQLERHVMAQAKKLFA